jgi:hypothetical protein
MAIKLFVLIDDKITGIGYTPAEVDAEILTESIGGKIHFAHRNLGGPTNWAVSEFTTGARVGDGWTLEGAIIKAKRNINGIGDEKYNLLVADTMAKYGVANPGAAPAPTGKSCKDIETELALLCPIEDEEEEF